MPKTLVRIEFKVLFPACRTGFVLSLEPVTACAAEVGAATTSQVWISEYQSTYRTLRLKNTLRWFDKLAIISSKHHLLLWPAMRLCSSLSSLWRVGGCGFLLLSKFSLLCRYNNIITLIRFIAVMFVCVNYILQ